MSKHNGILYARPDPSLKLQLRDVDEFSRNEGGLRFHELNRVFETFMEVFSSYIARGYRIETPIGSFYPKLTINADKSVRRRATPRFTIFNSWRKLSTKAFPMAISRFEVLWHTAA